MSILKDFLCDVLYAITEGRDSYIRARKHREYMRIRNMTPEEFNKMLEKQGRKL